MRTTAPSKNSHPAILTSYSHDSVPWYAGHEGHGLLPLLHGKAMLATAAARDYLLLMFAFFGEPM
jgi:hypothetical protein